MLIAECAPLIKAGETDRLQLMFRLLERGPLGVQLMLQQLERHISQAGLADMVAAADVITQDSEKYVERLLDLFRKFSKLVHDAFSDDPRFLTARDKAFEAVVNDTTVFRLELSSGRNVAGGRPCRKGLPVKKLKRGAWARGSERVTVSLPVELEDYIPEVEDFYKKKHSGRKLQWYHHMSNGTITFATNGGKFDLDVTTFQMAVLFAWNQRPTDKIAYENLRLATELPDGELRRTLWSLVAFPKLKRQLLQFYPSVSAPKDFDEHTVFWVNQDFALIKNGKPQKRGKVNLVGRLQLSTERSQIEDNQSIVQLRILRTQEAIIKILKMRKKITNTALQSELVDILKNMFLPSKKMIKEQLEWLIEHKYMRRDDDDINTFIYVA
ncbi:hypothetical protein D910_07247 [Dendroctonus ponderosae]|uniref:Cullin-5 n=1 Tax=Dendroctonus ponderosae TaxID=77166 RepID=U4UC67_DENPD|nr:hypothetical protein D910_07247 [Dendroctonus ponderosae]